MSDVILQGDRKLPEAQQMLSWLERANKVLGDFFDGDLDFQDPLEYEKNAAQAAFKAKCNDPCLWLQGLMGEMAGVHSCCRDQLVAHRGFHDPDFGLNRPVEGSISAYASAWRAGVKLCECDIRLTADGYLVLAHDDTLEKAAADPSDAVASMSVATSSLETLRSLTLKGGERIPLLSEVLELALRLGGKMVVEMKSQIGVGTALAALFRARPDLREACEVVMSFDVDLLLEFVTERAKEDRSFAADAPVMLLVCAEPTEDPKELVLDMAGDWQEAVSSWTRQGIDGMYIAWTPELAGPLAGELQSLRGMCKAVGVWQEHGQTDCEAEYVRLVGLGATYVNTDFPSNFRREK